MKTKRARLSVFGCELILVFLLAGGLLAQQAPTAGSPQGQAVPHLVKFSGTVKDTAGTPRTGVTGIAFALYKDQAGGAALWLETQNVTLDAQGRYTVLLGAASAEGLPVGVFSANEGQWLGVQPEGQAEQRVLLVSVPYALKAADAETLGGRPASSFVMAAPPTASDSTSAGQTGTGANAVGTSGPSPAVTGSGNPNTVAKFDASGTNLVNSLITDTGTLVGVNNPAPAAQLDVLLQTGAAQNALNSTLVLTNTTPIAGNVVSAMNLQLADASQATNLSKQSVRMVYIRDAAATGGVSAFDSVFTTSSFLHANTPYQLRAMNVEGPNVDSGMTLGTFYGAYFGAPNASETTPGKVTNNFALVTEPGAGNVGIGTTAPGSKLEVAGNVKVSGAGNALIFPDGTAMTSATSINGVLSASGGFLTTTPGKGIIVRSPDGTKCAQIGIDNTGSLTTVAVPCPLAITTTSLPNATVGTAYDQPIQTSAGDGTAITFALANSTTLPAWASLNTATGHITGTPAAGNVGTSAVFQISATQTGTTVTSGNLTITVVAGGVNNSELNGHYAFLLRGFDPSGNLEAIGGSFTADGAGNISGGVMDANDSGSTPCSPSASCPLTINAAPASFYSIGADNRGMLTLNTSAGMRTFDFSVGSISSGVASLGHIISRRNTSATNGSAISGVFKKQDTTVFTLTALNGDWAFLVEGASGSTGGRGVDAGRFTLNAGTVSNGIADDNTNGTFDAGTTTPSPLTGSFGSIDTTNGRVLATLTSVFGTSHTAVYIVSASEALIMSVDASSVSPLRSGSALRQSTTFCPTTGGCNFTNAAGNGTAILHAQGLGSGVAGTSKVEIVRLVLTPTGGSATTGSVSLTGDDNDSGTISLNQSASGITYTVSANGRVTSSGNTPPVLYLVDQNAGFFVDPSTNVGAGELEAQVGPITFASGRRTFGAEPPAGSGTLVFSGVQTVTATPPGCSPCTTATLSGTIDDTNSVSGGLHENVSVADDTITLDATTGRFTFASGARVGYFINSTRRATIDIRTADTAPNLLIADNQ